MEYEVIFSPSARRDLQSVPPRILPAIIEFVYGDLSRNPQRVGKALERDLAGFHSARRGPYRVLYSIDEEHSSISVLRVDHRADGASWQHVHAHLSPGPPNARFH